MPNRKPERRFDVLVTFTDRHGRIHLPPDPPLVEGYPPWFPRPGEYRREQPLGKCPSGRCRRAKSCVSPINGSFCRKTHMEAEAFRAALVQKIDRLLREYHGDEPAPANDEDDQSSSAPPPPEMKRALAAAMEDHLREELRKWQQNWANEMARKEKAATVSPP
jgi:hypothetical protein